MRQNAKVCSAMQQVKNAMGWNAMKLLRMHQNALICTGMRMGKNYTTFGKKLHLSRLGTASMLIFVTVATRPAPIDPRSPQLSTSLDRLKGFTKDSVGLSWSCPLLGHTSTFLYKTHMHCTCTSSLIGLIIGGLTCSEVSACSPSTQELSMKHLPTHTRGMCGACGPCLV